MLHGHVPAVTARLQPIGTLSGTNPLDLAVGLPLRNWEALTHLLREIYDPTSPNYRHSLKLNP
jgi:subtilase family serine protease